MQLTVVGPRVTLVMKMAHDLKYGKVDIAGIPDDEPVFIIRAKDRAAAPAIREYAWIAEEAGASEEFKDSIVEHVIPVFTRWQADNQTKVPD